MNAVVIVGSVNVDITLRVAAIPAPGETLAAAAIAEEQGGKGANQAAAVAALGTEAVLIGAVGDDGHGDAARADLLRRGVRPLLVTAAARTGSAYVTVDDAGENAIVVHAGANGLLGEDDVTRLLEPLAPSLPAGTVLVGCFEVPQEALLRAARIARDHGWTVIVNPAPAGAIDPRLLGMIDVLTPNESELAALGGSGALLAAGVRAIVGTRGAAGCVIERAGVATTTTTAIPGVPARVVNTVGAGDAFTGALAAALATGMPLEEAARYAVAAGAIATESASARAAALTDAAVRARAGALRPGE